MNSKEALELLYRNCPMTVVRENDGIHLYSEYLVEQIKQDLDRLESLEAKFDAYYELHKQLEKGYDDLSVENDKLIQENRKLKKVIKILKDKINSYLKTLYSKEYIETHIKGKYSSLGIANRNGQEKVLNTILELLKEYLDD